MEGAQSLREKLFVSREPRDALSVPSVAGELGGDPVCPPLGPLAWS